MSWRRSRSDGISWATVNPDVISTLVVEASERSCGISLGMTRDRSALSITVFAQDGAKETTYVRSTSDVNELLSDMVQPEFEVWAKEHSQPV